MDLTAITEVKAYLEDLQFRICKGLDAVDGQGTFGQDTWTRAEGGGGRSCTLEGGQVFEKAGVNFSDVEGASLPHSATAAKPHLANAPFRAMGVSLVLHPHNPYVPTVHLNVRFFVAQTPKGPVWWFGGGMDLTPYYGFEEDAIHWHTLCARACEGFGAGDWYSKYKEWSDTYFYLKHRGEARGIGGLFSDDVNSGNFEECFAFIRSIGDHFLAAYVPIVERRHGMVYGERERWFQEYRRGRYVEFNLVFDRGTLFGLQTGGRTESILMSLPPRVRWEYNWTPEPGTPEAKLYTDFLKPRDWLQVEACV